MYITKILSAFLHHSCHLPSHFSASIFASVFRHNYSSTIISCNHLLTLHFAKYQLHISLYCLFAVLKRRQNCSLTSQPFNIRSSLISNQSLSARSENFICPKSGIPAAVQSQCYCFLKFHFEVFFEQKTS